MHVYFYIYFFKHAWLPDNGIKLLEITLQDETQRAVYRSGMYEKNYYYLQIFLAYSAMVIFFDFILHEAVQNNVFFARSDFH